MGRRRRLSREREPDPFSARGRSWFQIPQVQRQPTRLCVVGMPCDDLPEPYIRGILRLRLILALGRKNQSSLRLTGGDVERKKVTLELTLLPRRVEGIL